jgi:hypothetical protein
MPLGVTCKKCGDVLCTIVKPDADKLLPLNLAAVCPRCLNAAAREMGITPDSDENWDKLIHRLGL